jgi:2-polyprenyl-6-methoxyphenol hydroxylase-like FAD-dependent oxidoreductase
VLVWCFAPRTRIAYFSSVSVLNRTTATPRTSTSQARRNRFVVGIDRVRPSGMESISTTVAIAGGGPAGMMLGLLLARAGIDVVVLEKHKDFLRDFRGDTIHPSTLEIIAELGLIERFLQRPHQEAREISAEIGKESFRIADFSHLPTRCKFLGFMPQWEFLDFLATEACRYPTFHVMMEAEATELLAKGRRIVGLQAETKDGPCNIIAALTIGADGRHSIVRARAALKVTDLGAPFDVLWLKLPADKGDPTEPIGRFQGGQFFIMLYRGGYWQCAMIIPKGGFAKIKAEGMSGFRARLRSVAGFARDRVDSIENFEQIALLTVKLDRLARWARQGLLCIGDAAHAMSPVGGVGINLAIQDAVAAANLLEPILRKRRLPSLKELDRVQKRRQWPTNVTQWFQLQVQNRVLVPSFQRQATPKPPFSLRLLNRVALLRRIPARVVGIGLRPEHVRTGEHIAPTGDQAKVVQTAAD